MNSEKNKSGDAPVPAPVTGGKGREAEISELKEIIEESAEKIKRYNKENISLLSEEEIKEEIKNATSEAIRLTKEYDINLYFSPFCDIPEYILNMLSSKNEEEFIRNLEVYASEIEEWAEIEEDSFYDNDVARYIQGNINDIKKSEYIVKVYQIDPCWADCQLHTVILCEDKKEAEQVEKIVRRGANVNTKIEEVTQRTAEDILKEYADDLIRYSNQYHAIQDLEIYTYEDIMNDDE